MGYAVGLAPDENKNGTKPADLQRWIWSLYRADTAQIVRGLEIGGRSNMSYSVNAGVIVVPVGAQRAIAVPVDGGTVATTPAPSSGTRTDLIYVGQDGAVKVGTSQPANTALLDKRRVPAGVTATTSTASLLGNRKYAPLFGSSMGLVAYWDESGADGSRVTDARKRMCALTFTNDSDRRMELTIQQTYEMTRTANSGTDGWKQASFVWEIWLDGEKIRDVELGCESFAETKQNRATKTILAGTHTIELYRKRRLMGNVGADDYPVLRTHGSETWTGTSFAITDLGGIA